VLGVDTILGGRDTKLGMGYGTFGKPAPAAYYLLFVAVITVTFALSSRHERVRNWWLAYAILVIGIYFSYKRAPLLLALMMPPSVAWFLGRRRFVRRYIGLGLLATPLLLIFLSVIKPAIYASEKAVELSPIKSLSQLFSEEYWTISSTKARGWMIMVVGRQQLESFKPIGYGADVENAQSALAVKGGEFGKLVGWGAFDDVYIVANLVYYGPVGVGLLLLAFYDLYRRHKVLARFPNPLFRVSGASISAIMILLFLSVFVTRLLEFRACALLFWFLCGVGVVAYQRGRRFHRGHVKIRPSSSGARNSRA
jgi:hypothetical protein